MIINLILNEMFIKIQNIKFIKINNKILIELTINI